MDKKDLQEPSLAPITRKEINDLVQVLEDATETVGLSKELITHLRDYSITFKETFGQDSELMSCYQKLESKFKF